MPKLSTGLPDGTSASHGRGSHRSATSSQPPTVVPTGSRSDQPDRELPHDLKQLQSVIRAEIQQVLATAVSQTTNTPASTQLAPPSSLASAAQTTPPTLVGASATASSQQTGQLALTPDCLFSGMCVCVGGYADECEGNVHTCVDVGARLCLELCVGAKVPAGVSVDAGARWASCMGCACKRRCV